MYKINECMDKFKIYELVDTDTNSWVKVCPERGGIITEYEVNGTDILYLDKNTFYNKETNIRGGIPILFPICGQLKDGKYTLNGSTYSMKNHGVARINPWHVTDTSTDGKSSITIEFNSTEETKKAFPFDFKLSFTYTLKDGMLTIDQEYMNLSEDVMPIYAGFHPYFKTSEKNIEYHTDTENYLDYNDMKVKKYNSSLDLNGMAESAVFLDAKENNISFNLPDTGKTIFMEYGKQFKYIVLWTEENKDFLCVEPWMAKTGEFHRQEELHYISPGDTLKTYLTIRCE